jgi:hypothetical protein
MTNEILLDLIGTMTVKKFGASRIALLSIKKDLSEEKSLMVTSRGIEPRLLG